MPTNSKRPSATLGNKVKRLRLAAGLSQQQLAAAIGSSLGKVTNIEQGIATDPKWSTIKAIARVLNVTTDELASDS